MAKKIEWGNIPMKGELNSCTILDIARSEGGKANKGNKLSNEHKKLLSKLKIGTKMSKEAVAKSIAGSKETKWNQLLEKYPLNLIKKIQKKHNNHQTNTCKDLGISFISYKKLCKHYNIEKKKSSNEKAEYAITKQSNPILVWKEKNGIKIGKPTHYYSVSECV